MVAAGLCVTGETAVSPKRPVTVPLVEAAVLSDDTGYRDQLLARGGMSNIKECGRLPVAAGKSMSGGVCQFQYNLRKEGLLLACFMAKKPLSRRDETPPVQRKYRLRISHPS